MINSWLIYRSNCVEVGDRKHLPLMKFMAEVGTAMTSAGKPILQKKRGRPSTSTNYQQPEVQRKHNVSHMPIPEVHYDNIGHFSIAVPKTGRCRALPRAHVRFHTHEL